MSIEWLLVKNKDTKIQKKVLQRTQKENELSDKIHNKLFEIDLRCDCGYEGTYAYNKKDFNFVGKDKKGLAYFECPNCKRRLQHEISTTKTKIQKKIFRFFTSWINVIRNNK